MKTFAFGMHNLMGLITSLMIKSHNSLDTFNQLNIHTKKSNNFEIYFLFDYLMTKILAPG